MRLGHKYDMAHIEHEALEYLNTILLESPLYHQTIPWPPQGFSRTSAIGVVNIARLTGTHSLLPVALYRCCRLDASAITTGYTYSDGEQEVLLSEDLGRCYLGRSKLVQEMYGNYSRAFFAALDPGRRNGRQCRKNNACWTATAIQRFFTVTTSLVDNAKHPHPFGRLETLLAADHKKVIFCDSCWEVYRECEGEEHETLWKRFPSVFGLDLPKWE